MAREIVSVDLGGTHSRFALATVGEGKVVGLDEPITLETDRHATFASAWRDFGTRIDRPVPRGVAIAVAGPVGEGTVRMTNHPWTLRKADLPEEIGVDDVTLVNDFAAVAHAVAQLGPDQFDHLAGPDRPLPETGRISIVGPGTGLGVAHVGRSADGYHVQATEGGHIDFAPIDPIDDALLLRLRARHRRVSVERVASGPAIVDIYETLARLEDRAVRLEDDVAIWTAAMERRDPLAEAAVERFCMALGSIAGDITLAQGGDALVIAGGVGLRLADGLRRSGFAARFRAKGRFERMMEKIPVRLIVHPQPGLYGAAAAFAQAHC